MLEQILKAKESDVFGIIAGHLGPGVDGGTDFLYYPGDKESKLILMAHIDTVRESRSKRSWSRGGWGGHGGYGYDLCGYEYAYGYGYEGYGYGRTSTHNSTGYDKTKYSSPGKDKKDEPVTEMTVAKKSTYQSGKYETLSERIARFNKRTKEKREAEARKDDPKAKRERISDEEWQKRWNERFPKPDKSEQKPIDRKKLESKVDKILDALDRKEGTEKLSKKERKIARNLLLGMDHGKDRDKERKERTAREEVEEPEEPVVLKYYGTVVMNENGILGADDRAGCYALICIHDRIVEHNDANPDNLIPMPGLLFTNHEESGGSGMREFVKQYGKSDDLARYDLLLELDRRGCNDWVSYNDVPSEVASYIRNFGFIKQRGSFSDIKYLVDATEAPGLNLSIGYYNEHSSSEELHIDEMMLTVGRVINIIKNPIGKKYAVKERVYQQFKYESKYGSVTYTKVVGSDEKANSVTVKKPYDTGLDEDEDEIWQWCPDCGEYLTQRGRCKGCGYIEDIVEGHETQRESAKKKAEDEMRATIEAQAFAQMGGCII